MSGLKQAFLCPHDTEHLIMEHTSLNLCVFILVTKDNINTVCHMDSCPDKIQFIIFVPGSLSMGFPSSSDGKASACNAGDTGSIPGLERFPWRRKWQPIPVFLPGEFHGQRSLAAYIQSMGSQDSDMTW